MATDRAAVLSVPVAAAMLLWPALWNGYPIVFADTGTYLSQAIHRYAGWDRPIFYSLFMLPLHATVTTWPVVAVQALLAAWVLRLTCRVLVPWLPEAAFLPLVAAVSLGTWLPWLAGMLMPNLFTPLLVPVLSLLALVPERLTRWERIGLSGLAAGMIACQLSSLPLACVLALVLLGIRGVMGPGWSAAGQAALPLVGLMALSALMFPGGVALVAVGQVRFTLYANLPAMVVACLGVMLLRPADPWQAVLIWTISQILVCPYALWVNARALGVGMLRPLTGGLRLRAPAR